MDEQRSLAVSTVKGTIWNYVTFGASKLVTFISTAILARLLSIDDFGIMALGLIAIGYLDTLNGMGVEQVVIYKQKNIEKISDAAFTLSLVVNALLTAIAFLFAPAIALFFKEPRLVNIVRALSLTFIIGALGAVHEARLKKDLRFRRTVLPEVSKTIVKAVVSIGMALLGYGVWSLVWGQIASVLTANILYVWVFRWRPKLVFDLTIMREIIGYSSQIVLTDIMGMIQNNIDYVIIGRRMDSERLGYYTIAFRVPELLIVNMCVIVGTALFPAYSKLQNSLETLRKGFLATLRFVSLYTVPIGVGLSIVSPQFIEVAFGERWLPAAPLMQALSLYAMFYSLSFNAGDIYKAIGRPDILNKLSVIQLLIVIPALWFSAGYGVFYVALAQVILSALLAVVKLLVIRRLIGLHFVDILSAIRPGATGAIVMVAAVLGLQVFVRELSPLLQLLILSLSGGLIYVATIWLTNREVVWQGVNVLRDILVKRPRLNDL